MTLLMREVLVQARWMEEFYGTGLPGAEKIAKTATVRLVDWFLVKLGWK
jgi:hypothetical protein